MLARTHTIEMSADSTYIIVRDTTPIVDYTAVTLDPIDDVTAISLRLTDDTTNTLNIVNLTASKVGLRDVNGVKVYAIDLGLGSKFINDLWNTELDYVFVSTYTSISNDFLFEDIKNKVAVAMISSDWKYSFNYNSLMTFSKYSLKLKSWLDQLVLANENNLLSEGRILLNSLKSIL